MGKKPTPEQVAWQEAARGQIAVVLDRLFDGNQTRLAKALGVTQALVSMVVRGVQPPTRDLIARLAGIDRVDPEWIATGHGNPILPDIRGTLPVSDDLLAGPPNGRNARERFPIAQGYDLPSRYFWRVPADHMAAAVADWHLRSGDLILLDTARETSSDLEQFLDRMCVIDTRPFGTPQPAYGLVYRDEQSRPVFGTPAPVCRYGTPPPPDSRPDNRPRRRTVRSLERDARRAAEIAADPWTGLDWFTADHVLGVQVLMIRP